MKPIHATTVHLHETCTSTVTEKAIHSASSWNLYKQLKRLFIQHLHETYISNCVKAIHSASLWNLYKQLERLFIQHLHETYTSNCKGCSFSTFMKTLQATAKAIHSASSWNLQYISNCKGYLFSIFMKPTLCQYISNFRGYSFITIKKPIQATSVAIHSTPSWNLYKQLPWLFIEHHHETYTL